MLQRDGRNVVTDSSCAAVSGTWYSPYDGATWTAASDVDIDHMVPLRNAWIVSTYPHTPDLCTITKHRSVLVRRCQLDHLPPPGLRQRHQRSPAVGRHRQRQPGQERPQPRLVETSPDQLLLHLRLLVDPSQVHLGPDRHQRRAECSVEHAELLLNQHFCLVLAAVAGRFENLDKARIYLFALNHEKHMFGMWPRVLSISRSKLRL